MDIVPLQDWTTISAAGSAQPVVVAQEARQYLDVSGYDEAVFYLQVQEFSIVQVTGGNPTITIVYQTAPVEDDAMFVATGTSPQLLTTSTFPSTVTTPVLLSGQPPVPIARWLRWKLVFSIANASSALLTFRITAALGRAV